MRADLTLCMVSVSVGGGQRKGCDASLGCAFRRQRGPFHPGKRAAKSVMGSLPSLSVICKRGLKPIAPWFKLLRK